MSEQQQHGAHTVHAPNGGDGQSLANFGGLDKHGHNFISHLLGLDHDAHVGAPVHSSSFSSNAQGQALQAPTSRVSWTKALGAVKLSDVLQGVKLTPNMLFIMLYASFVGWLFVIYWIRHHEPLANSVLGTSAPGSATAAADRRIIAGTKFAVPVRTSSETGDIYIPGNDQSSYNAPPRQLGNYFAPTSFPLPAPPVPPTPAPEPQPMPLTGIPLSPGYGAGYGQPGAYMVSEPESSGSRVKMIVNR